MLFNIASQPGFSTNVVLKIEKGGKLNLCTGMEQKVRQFHTTTRQRNAHQYTGTGDIGRKLPNYLLGKGVLTVREDGPQGAILRLR